MNALVAATVAEYHKLRRTLARGSALITPVIAVLLSLFVLTNVDALAAAKQMAPWEAYVQSLMRMWAIFLLPMMITLQAVLLAQLEHANRQWKFLLTLPVPRGHLFLAKLLNLLALLVVAHAVLIALAAVTASAAGLAPPGSQGVLAVLGTLSMASLRTICASTLLAALQLAIAIRLESFAGAIAVGLVATLIGVLGGNSLGNLAAVYPWAMPLHSLNGGGMAWLLAILAAAAAAAAMGTQLMRRMQVQ